MGLKYLTCNCVLPLSAARPGRCQAGARHAFYLKSNYALPRGQPSRLAVLVTALPGPGYKKYNEETKQVLNQARFRVSTPESDSGQLREIFKVQNREIVFDTKFKIAHIALTLIILAYATLNND